MSTGICGGERDLLIKGGCLEKSMPQFVKCAASPYVDVI